MLDLIEIHFTIEKNGKQLKRRAIVKDMSRLKAIRLPPDFELGAPPPAEVVEIFSVTPGDAVDVNDPGPQVCYDIDTGTFCW